MRPSQSAGLAAAGFAAACIFGAAPVLGKDRVETVQLDSQNFDKFTKLDQNGGKTAFVNFCVDYAGDCRVFKPVWNKLGGRFADSPTVVIGEVNCNTHASKNLCMEHQIGTRWPTIQYFHEHTGLYGMPYEGLQDYETLKAFTMDNLGGKVRKCNLDTHEQCLPYEIVLLNKYMNATSAEVDAEHKRVKEQDKLELKSNVRREVDLALGLLPKIKLEVKDREKKEKKKAKKAAKKAEEGSQSEL
eukprot:gnl/TRDRNA2_/TRDRNA2_189758_c0_seq1.p1 gnl/TRDRNA2_/TRDRNA2_189758_c0~~gnl/TRDRNA2_/TRDRNA2_189758_c0_seq1.p1  ORF type:complete len:244 (-),score=52.09 gnl/TRDRNA2_/TRDRNA2_189758_c0_seq1:107-838(-)